MRRSEWRECWRHPRLPPYSDLREGSDPEGVLEDGASFLTRAIGRRKELENKLETRQPGSQAEVLE